jgi:hypothetical protein
MSSGLFSFTACSTSRICRFISGLVTFGWMPARARTTRQTPDVSQAYLSWSLETSSPPPSQ